MCIGQSCNKLSKLNKSIILTWVERRIRPKREAGPTPTPFTNRKVHCLWMTFLVQKADSGDTNDDDAICLFNPKRQSIKFTKMSVYQNTLRIKRLMRIILIVKTYWPSLSRSIQKIKTKVYSFTINKFNLISKLRTLKFQSPMSRVNLLTAVTYKALSKRIRNFRKVPCFLIIKVRWEIPGTKSLIRPLAAI